MVPGSNVKGALTEKAKSKTKKQNKTKKGFKEKVRSLTYNDKPR